VHTLPSEAAVTQVCAKSRRLYTGRVHLALQSTRRESRLAHEGSRTRLGGRGVPFAAARGVRRGVRSLPLTPTAIGQRIRGRRERRLLGTPATSHRNMSAHRLGKVVQHVERDDRACTVGRDIYNVDAGVALRRGAQQLRLGRLVRAQRAHQHEVKTAVCHHCHVARRASGCALAREHAKFSKSCATTGDSLVVRLTADSWERNVSIAHRPCPVDGAHVFPDVRNLGTL